MKWKKILQIPWITPQIPKKRGKLEFTVAAQLHEVDDHQHLIVDLYSLENTVTPIARGAYTKTDCGAYIPADKSFRKAALTHGDDADLLEIVSETEYLDPEKENTYITQETMEELIDLAYGDIGDHKYIIYDWVMALAHMKRDVLRQKRDRAFENRNRRLNERIRDMPEIPEAFERYAYSLTDGYNFVYYKRSGRRAELRCSCCGMTWSGYTRRGETLEAAAEHIVAVPRDKAPSVCECCGALGVYKPIGRCEGVYGIEKPVYLIQPFRNQMVVRQFVSEKYISTDAPEQKKLIEISRAYSGKRVQIDYHKHSGFTGNDFWDDCNLYGMNNIPNKKARVWSGSWGQIRISYGMEEYCNHFGEEADPVRYLQNISKKPYLEMMVKNRLWEVLEKELNGIRTVMNYPANKPDMLFGIYKHRFKMLREHGGNFDILKALQQEKRFRCNWTQEQIEKLAILMRGQSPETAFRIMSLQKFLNRVEKYAGCQIMEGCANALSRIREITGQYIDYLSMRQAAGYDLTDQIIQHPKDLSDAHHKMVLETNEKKEELHCAMKEHQYADIKEKFEKLNRIYSWEEEDLLIRPAGSATEIIMEGRELHHCVGGDNYLGKHTQGKSFILFLRDKSTPQTPYITVEIQPETNRIMQWYGKLDSKPDKEHIDAWLKRYTEILTEYGTMEAYRKEALRVRVNLMEG